MPRHASRHRTAPKVPDRRSASISTTLGKTRETLTRFGAMEPNRKIEFEAKIGPMRPKCDLTFEGSDGGTRVTFRGDSNPSRPLKWLSPLANRKGQQVWQERLGRIKTMLESSSR